MPNGGMHHCALNCCHFDNESSLCRLRHVHIEFPFWTTCENFNIPGATAVGPIYAIVCEVRNETGGYCDIPYFDGCRVDTLQTSNGCDTVVCFTDRTGVRCEFPTVQDYLAYYEKSSRNAVMAQLQIPREKALALGSETTDILGRGHYIIKSGIRVDIKEQVAESVRGTVSYPPDLLVQATRKTRASMLVEVKNETTLEAAKCLIAKGFKPVVLNFASATSPGGGFLNGARAQEEYLARSSALWACLRDNVMYSYHRLRRDPFYSDYVIYSPDVPVFRDDDGELLEFPYSCCMITSPAVHATAVRRYCPDRINEIPGVMWNRILKVLAVAEKHGHKALVLGAWGCGAFGNNSADIASLFRKVLQEHFHGTFKHIIFAVTDWSDDQHFIGPFLREFRRTV